jgi:aspartyl-tRNA(Asn)/glutamyl-tRNA(Gln) amidotransferase subunit B
MKYDTFIGLEIHIHLKTKSKMFCSCVNEPWAEPNTNICPICLGYPGVLPQVNGEALKLSYILADHLNCELAKETTFERKNYFYPDMAKNYQISQFEHPVGKNGWIEFPFKGETRKIRIHDVHLEEDAGKLIHAGDISLIDYNRAGVALLEIVTEPDFASGDEVEAFLRYFQRCARYTGVSTANMDEGSMRCDANISINYPGKGLGTKTEIKNMNSPRFVKMAMEYEQQRHGDILDAGKTVVQETRLWNENRDITSSMRTKESAHDYRYFPDPDIPVFKPDADFMIDVRNAKVELPNKIADKLCEQLDLDYDTAWQISETRALAEYYLKLSSLGVEIKTAIHWLQGYCKSLAIDEEFIDRISPNDFAQAMIQLQDGRINKRMLKKAFEKAYRDRIDLTQALSEDCLIEGEELKAIVLSLLIEKPSSVQEIAEGNNKQMDYLMGQIMRMTSGKAKPSAARSMLSDEIDKLAKVTA